MYKNLISFFSLKIQALFCVRLVAGELCGKLTVVLLSNDK